MSAFGNLLKEKLKPINDLRTQVATTLSNRKLRARGLFQINNEWLSYDLPDGSQEVLVFQTGNVYTSQVHVGLERATGSIPVDVRLTVLNEHYNEQAKANGLELPIMMSITLYVSENTGEPVNFELLED